MGQTRRGTEVMRTIATLAIGSMVAAALVIGGGSAALADDLTTPPPLLQRDSDVATADALPTVQIDDGYVWAQTTVGTTVYAVGQFTNARAALASPGTQLTPRTNILAFDLVTGELLPFAPAVNGVIKAVAASSDGSRIYIGGSFNSVNGESRWNIAALDAHTGQLVPGFRPSIGGTGVYALAIQGDTVYAGGLFTQANATPRKNLAAFNAATGALQVWEPQTNLQVDAMVIDPAGQNVIAGGRFSQVNGNTAMRGLAALDRSTGAVDTGWAAPQTVKNGATSGKAGIFSLTTDSSGVYGTGWVFADLATGNLEGAFAADAGSGNIRWIADCLGDHYGVYSTGKVVYTTSHTHACSTMGLHPQQSNEYRYAEAFTADVGGLLGHQPAAGSTYKDWYGTPAPSPYYWAPDFTVGTTSGLGQAGLSITGAGGFISIAGEFGSVNNQRYQGIVRFSNAPASGPKQAPRLNGSSWVPTGLSVVPGRARVTVSSNWDRDDLNLTYDLMRSGTSTPIATTTGKSTWWNLPAITLQDTTAVPGQTYTYTVVARDPDGNKSSSQPVTVKVADGAAAEYVDAVISDGAQLYYPMGDTTQDWAGANPAVFGNGVSARAPGVQQSSTGYSAFSGTSSGQAASSSRIPAPAEFSAELWFSSTTNRGGKLIGYGDAASGNSGSYDRHVYMTNNGKLVFGVYPGAVRTVQSQASYNDGKWHHVVASQSSSGIQLYVDGALVGSDSSVTTAQDYLGYWRIGGDNLNGWTSAPNSSNFSGSIDEVAVYPRALTEAQVRTHYGIGTGLQPPTASFEATSADLQISVDASASNAAGTATIAQYEWDFGDGSAAVQGVTASHDFGAAGSYDVSLTVVDSEGLRGTTQRTVAVQASNVAPVAEFDSQVNGLTVSVDGSASSDSDGTITGYSWNWGDGSPASAGPIATHRFAAVGTQIITLTVTDDRGGETHKAVEVDTTHADPIAEFSNTTSGLRVDVDATRSAASDGATLQYRWSWGDGTAESSGATSSHTYADDGDHEITLTVSDSIGAVAHTTRTVSVTAEQLAAFDGFGRVISSGWGAADSGGVWAVTGGSTMVASVDGSRGRMALPAGGGRTIVLQGTTLADTRSEVTYELENGPQSGAIYVGIESRNSGAQNYRAAAWHRADGTTWLLIQRNGTAISTFALPSGAWSAGSTFHIASETTGSDSVRIRAKLWADGTPEPTGWQLEATDASPGALAAAGSTGVYAYRAGSATGQAPLSFDALQIKDVSVPVANAAPVGAFVSTVTDLSVAVDASSSTDSDGSIASYAWDFGDGGSGAGATPTHTYAEAGTYSVALTVTDDKGATGTTTHEITVSSTPGQNAAPVGAFVSTVTDLSVAVDASSSTDSDGSIASYAWDFGDGGSGAGVTPTHTYAEAGTYSVALTVTDDKGATGTITHEVTVSAPAAPQTELAGDDFDRSVAGGWGNAKTGGAWSVTGGPVVAASVTDGAGTFVLAAGGGRDAVLRSTPLADSVLTTEFRVTPGAESGATYVGFVARDTGASRYFVRAWLRPDGTVWILAQRDGNTLAVAPLAGVTYEEGASYTLKVSVTGSGQTAIAAKFWKTDATEPTAWQLTTIDSTPALQTGGAVGLSGYRAGNATAPVTVSFDTFEVVAAQ